MLDEGVGSKWLSEAICNEAVLGEAEVEHRGDVDLRGAELFLLFDKVGASDLQWCQWGGKARSQSEGVRSQLHISDVVQQECQASLLRLTGGLD